jgi:hypothetical protein
VRGVLANSSVRPNLMIEMQSGIAKLAGLLHNTLQK